MTEVTGDDEETRGIKKVLQQCRSKFLSLILGQLANHDGDNCKFHTGDKIDRSTMINLRQETKYKFLHNVQIIESLSSQSNHKHE